MATYGGCEGTKCSKHSLVWCLPPPGQTALRCQPEGRWSWWLRWCDSKHHDHGNEDNRDLAGWSRLCNFWIFANWLTEVELGGGLQVVHLYVNLDYFDHPTASRKFQRRNSWRWPNKEFKALSNSGWGFELKNCEWSWLRISNNPGSGFQNPPALLLQRSMVGSNPRLVVAVQHFSVST